MPARHEQMRDNRRDAHLRRQFFRTNRICLTNDPFSGLLLPSRRGAHAWEFTLIGSVPRVVASGPCRLLGLNQTSEEIQQNCHDELDPVATAPGTDTKPSQRA